ncbi:MAG TPA: phosphate signaling complex protein PhoU [Acidimicrobiia bacterium]|nr:phosphate signaling complex protein PhoU [Acidimicrobiia bacterium]
MADTRFRFHDELETLEQKLLSVADQAEQMVEMAVDAYTEGDLEAADRVIELDSVIDQTYLDVHNAWLHLMARQQPMGSDLRRMSMLLHMNTTLERMGDQTVNIAKMAHATTGLPRVDKIAEELREMGDLVRAMVRTGIEALVRRDADEARLLPAMDEPVDRLNRDMYQEVVKAGSDPGRLEWAIKAMMVSRALERVGDQVVDIGEQLAFLLTGEMAEFDESGLGRSDVQPG